MRNIQPKYLYMKLKLLEWLKNQRKIGISILMIINKAKEICSDTNFWEAQVGLIDSTKDITYLEKFSHIMETLA